MFGMIAKWAIVIVALVLGIRWLCGSAMTGGCQELGGLLESPVVAAVVASVVVAAGWFISARLQARRSLEQTRLQFRTKYLVDIFRTAEQLLKPIDEETTDEKYISPEWERVLHDVQLFGSAEQINIVQRLNQSLSEGKSFHPFEIVESMRHELREELGLDPAPIEFLAFRVTRPPKIDSGENRGRC